MAFACDGLLLLCLKYIDANSEISLLSIILNLVPDVNYKPKNISSKNKIFYFVIKYIYIIFICLRKRVLIDSNE